MSRIQFNALAAILAANRFEMTTATFAGLVSDIADVCQHANRAFDRKRFQTACNACEYHPAIKTTKPINLAH
jgi:hypothetical protein